MSWPARIAEIVAREGAAARVVIVATHGPTPRAEGAAMLVWGGGHEGKIGRPDVDDRAVGAARRLIGQLASQVGTQPAWLREQLRFGSGDVLGEATGGSIEVLVEVFGPREASALARLIPAGDVGVSPVLARPLSAGVAPEIQRFGEPASNPLWSDGLGLLQAEPHRTLVRIAARGAPPFVLECITVQRPQFCVYGTGLVARALVGLLAALPFDVIWLDTLPGHFPTAMPPGVATVVSAAPADFAEEARAGAFHAVMTNDHDLDLAICRAVLRAGPFAFLGVIGSRLKRERLVARLRAEGLGEDTIARIACPIGLPQIRSKVPAVIALGIAAQALELLHAAGADRGLAQAADAPPAGSKA